MKITDLPHYQPKERATPVRHELPPTPERDENAPVTIIGTVKQVRNWSVLLWDCPEQKWYSLANQTQADQMQDALTNNLKVRVTVHGMNVKEIVI